MYPEIVRNFGDEVAEWRALTPGEADAVVAGLGLSAAEVCWVVDAGSGFVGSARLHSFDHAGRTAAYAVGLLSPDVLGHGLGTEVTRLVLAHAFDDLRLVSLTVRVLEFNSRAIACYARCGFSFDRRIPDAVVLSGNAYADVIMRLDAGRYRLLASTWCAAPGPSAL